MNFNNYLKENIKCKCGHLHGCDIKDIIIKHNALQKLPQLLREEKIRKVSLVYDDITYKIAGEAVEKLLDKEDFVWKSICLKGTPLLPDERAAEQLEKEIWTESEMIIGIGSGTINDICKYFAYQKKLSYGIVATAPSMDGYASNVAAMLFHNAKVTLEAARPVFILADTDILAHAPSHMIAAGVGDMLGKYVCLADWQLANWITGEYFCEFVRDIMKEALEKVSDSIPALSKGDGNAIERLMEGLILSGIAMSYLGNSRPASGSEHHMSHYWEMIFLQQGKEAVLHGTKVGVGTVVGLSLYHALGNCLNQLEKKACHRMDRVMWKTEIKKAYGECADEVIALEENIGKNRESAVLLRLDSLYEKKDRVLELAQSLPSERQIADYLYLLHAPFLPSHIGVDKEMTVNAVLYAKDLRNRYGILQLYYDINKQEYASYHAAKIFDNEFHYI